jgi:hypothetical protein
VFFAVGAFAENKAFELALRREFVAQEERVPLCYGVLVIATKGEYTGGIGRIIHGRTEDCCKETTNAETIRSIL